MNWNKLKLGLLSASLVTSIGIQAQNSNVVSAAVEYKKFDMAFYTGNMEQAKEVLLKSKEYIDPAMEHASTKEDAKAHLYNGKIHFGLALVSGVLDDEALKEFQSEENKERYESSLKFAHNHRKFKRDVEDFVNNWVTMSTQAGTASFENEDFVSAFAGFAGAYELSKILDKDDADMKNNAMVSAQNAINKFKNDEDYDGAIEFIKLTKEVFPGNVDLTIQAVNLAFAKGDMEQATTFLNEAVETDPENDVLFATMGTVFLGSADDLAEQLKGMDVTDPNFTSISDLAEESYAKAEANLSKALELNPKNKDAAYNLGVLYLGKGEKLSLIAKQMDFNDPRYNETVAQSEEMYKKAIVPLEMYIEQEPDNTGVLQVLFQVHRKAGNTEKALEYKRRAEGGN